MKSNTQRFLEKAERAIKTAEYLLVLPDLEAATARAYYAMFYIAEGLLNEKDLSFKKHSGVLGAFGQYFSKTGLMDVKFHQYILSAYNKRIIADYGVDEEIENSEVSEMIQHAREFIEAAKTILNA